MTLTGLSLLCSYRFLFVETLWAFFFFFSCEKSLVEAGWVLCSGGNEVFTWSNLSWEWAPALRASCQGSYLLCSRALLWYMAVASLPQGVMKEVPSSWVAGTCLTKSSGISDELLEADLMFAEAPMVRGEIWVYMSLETCGVWQRGHCILNSAESLWAGNSFYHTALQLSSTAANKHWCTSGCVAVS